MNRLELKVSSNHYETIQINQKGTLTFKGSEFIEFKRNQS